MKRLTLIGLLLVLLLPATALAARFESGEHYVLPSGETVSGDLFVSGDRVTVRGTVEGDLFVAAGRILVEGRVTGDVFAAGGEIEITGTVGRSIRVAGGNVDIEAAVGRNVLAAAGNLAIREGARIAGDVDLGAGEALLAGTTGPVQAGIGNLRVEETAVINGGLTYWSEERARIADGAAISGEVAFNQKPESRISPASWIGGWLVFLATLIASGLAFLWLFPRKSTAVATEWRTKFGWSLLWGFLFTILTPVAAVIAIVTIVGIPFGIGGFLLWLALLYIGTLATAIALGAWAERLISRGEDVKASWISVLLGVGILAILWMIPIVGWLAALIASLAGLGALIRFDWRGYRKLRTEKRI